MKFDGLVIPLQPPSATLLARSPKCRRWNITECSYRLPWTRSLYWLIALSYCCNAAEKNL